MPASAGNGATFFSGPFILRKSRSAFFGRWTEPMFSALRGNPTDRLSDLAPTGTMISGRHGRFMTEAIRRTSQEVREPKERK
jgi:hypothetical protein